MHIPPKALFRAAGEATYQAPDPTIPPIPKSVFLPGVRMVFCIGAQKAGTSWLHDYLGRSESVHFSRNKELHYFDVRAGQAGMALRLRVEALARLSEKLNTRATRLNEYVVDRIVDAAELLSIYTGKGEAADRHLPYLEYLFTGWKGAKLAADITPSYAILSRHDFADMAAVGDARFIFLMRDPVARLWSHVRMMAQSRLPPEAGADEVLTGCRAWVGDLVDQGFLGTLERSDYLRTIRELEAAVPRDRISYVFYEDLFMGSGTDQICAFLGVPHIPPEPDHRVNEGRKIPIPEDLRDLMRGSLDTQYRGIRDRFGDAVPVGWAD